MNAPGGQASDALGVFGVPPGPAADCSAALHGLTGRALLDLPVLGLVASNWEDAAVSFVVVW